MKDDNRVEIKLGGKSYFLKGSETTDYLIVLGNYIEEKYRHYHNNSSFRNQTPDMQHMLMQLNIADEYFKMKEKNSMCTKESSSKDKEIAELKRLLVSAQIKADNLQLELDQIKKDLKP